MGCGTAILAILAAKKGASKLVAIDNDEVCYQSSIENAALNGIDNLVAVCGGKEVIPATAASTLFWPISTEIFCLIRYQYTQAY